MELLDHLRSVHKSYTKELCRVCGMRACTAKDKSLKASTRQCVHHMKTILNLFHIDISKDELVHSPTLCHACYSKMKF